MTYSPELRKCIDEIKEVMKKHDVGAVVTLHDGQGMSEFGMFLDLPSWSKLQFMEEGRVYIKAHMKSDRENSNRTVNMLVHARDLSGRNFLCLDQIMGQVGKVLNIERDEPKTYRREDQ
jgi:hypothetical protein